ncbi:MAG TPA: helix-turn-helix domain-containing protein [Dehalococcoidia bacterium]|nr:helix-turn-helix domain-containing protein [Dehalococcoidia bacterium]
MAEDRLLRVPQVAERLDLSEATILNWLRAGKLKGFRAGGTRAGWRVREQDLEAFIAAQYELAQDGEAE